MRCKQNPGEAGVSCGCECETRAGAPAELQRDALAEVSLLLPLPQLLRSQPTLIVLGYVLQQVHELMSDLVHSPPRSDSEDERYRSDIQNTAPGTHLHL